MKILFVVSIATQKLLTPAATVQSMVPAPCEGVTLVLGVPSFRVKSPETQVPQRVNEAGKSI